MKVYIIKDSISPLNKRIVTFILEYQRYIHSELMTHRMLSRNTASSRAIPASKVRDLVLTNPAVPSYWGKNKSGMKASEEISDIDSAIAWWTESLQSQVKFHEQGEQLQIHKQVLNRILEPYFNITCIVTVTANSLPNLFYLRDDVDAQPEIRNLVHEMKEQYLTHVPNKIGFFDWHLPLITEDDIIEVQKKCKDIKLALPKISAARCARVSYLTHEGKRDINKDFELFDKLVGGVSSGRPGHWSPLEHPATPHIFPRHQGNFYGWKQLRKAFKNENYTGSF